MKKVLIACAFLIGMSAMSFAQGGGQRRTPDEQVAALKTQLTGLTDDQTAKIKTIYIAAAASRDSLMKTATGADRTLIMPVYMKIQANTDAKIKAVLTTDQAAAYQKIADDRAAQMRARMQGN